MFIVAVPERSIAAKNAARAPQFCSDVIRRAAFRNDEIEVTVAARLRPRTNRRDGPTMQ